MSDLVGRLDAEGRRAMPALPVLRELVANGIDLGEVHHLQATFETSRRNVLNELPPALMPTSPCLLNFSVYTASEGPLGPFGLACARIACIAGLARRALVISCVTDNDALRGVLRDRWGLPVVPGRVTIAPRADAIRAMASIDGEPALDLELQDPVVLPNIDIPTPTGLHLAFNAGHARLVEVEAEHAAVDLAQRGRPRALLYDAQRWGGSRLQPTMPMIATYQRVQFSLRSSTVMYDPDVEGAKGVIPITVVE